MGKRIISNSELFGAGRIGPAQTMQFYMQALIINGAEAPAAIDYSFVIGDVLGYSENYRAFNSDIDVYYANIPSSGFFIDPANYFDYTIPVISRSVGSMSTFALILIRGQQWSYPKLMEYLRCNNLYVSEIDLQFFPKTTLSVNGLDGGTTAGKYHSFPQLGLVNERPNKLDRDFYSPMVFADPANAEDDHEILRIPTDVILSKYTGITFRKKVIDIEEESTFVINVGLKIHTWDKK